MKKTKGAKKIFFGTKEFNKKARAVKMNIMKFCSTDRELRLVNEIAWSRLCLNLPHQRHETSRFRRLPGPPLWRRY